MTAYQGGDPQAFRELFARFSPQLLRALYRYGTSEADVRDLVQQTFLQLHRARHDYKPGARFRPWIFTIAFNLGRDLVRRRGRKGEEELPAELPTLGGDSPLEAVEQQQRRSQLQRALDQLPPPQREAIILHWFEGLSFAEIAEATGSSVSAVKVRAHRAYRRLREILEHVTEPTGAT